MDEYNKFDIANWFLVHDAMTPKKLQKILYYTYAWGLVFFNDSSDTIDNREFNGTFEAWVHGPVDTEVYAH